MSIVTGKVRLSYANLLEPRAPQGGGDPKYSATLLLPKSDAATLQAIQTAIQAATQEGIAKRWNGRQPARIDIPIHDGDGARPNGEPFGDECKGCWVFTASSKQQPGIVDQRVQPILDSTKVYSGMYAFVEINFFPYSANGKNGIGVGLNNIQKVADGEPLAGRRPATEVFKPVAAPMGNPAAQNGPAPAAQNGPAPASAGFNPYQPQQAGAPVGYGADQYGQQPAAPISGQPAQPWL